MGVTSVSKASKRISRMGADVGKPAHSQSVSGAANRVLVEAVMRFNRLNDSAGAVMK